MGQTGSQPLAAAPQRAHRAHTLPHEPLRHAPKVLPSLTQSPRLRSTDNGSILHSGGTISGRRALTGQEITPNGHFHSNVYRSRSAGGGESGEVRSRERDPLHRSHTNLDLRHNDSSSLNKRFGSEPDLRVEDEQPKPRLNNNNKHFKKKYRAPQPPVNDNNCEGSSPDSSDGNVRHEPHKKLRLFKTKNETKKLNGHVDTNIPVYRSTYTDYKSLDLHDHQQFERRYRSPCKDKEQHLKYPESKDMVQTSASLKREERIQQAKQECKKTRIDRVSGCRAKTTKSNENNEAWKTPLLNRNFRYSERFKREESEQPCLRREKTFDNSLNITEKEIISPKATHESRMRAIGEQLKEKRLGPLATTSQPLRKSLPSLLVKSSEEKDDFQVELKKATSRIRNDLGSKINNVSENKPSQNDLSTHKPNPTKTELNSKVKNSSPKVNNVNIRPEKAVNSRRPLTRVNENKPKSALQVNTKTNINNNASKYKFNSKESNKSMPDRGQASGKESTPEHSPTRKKQPLANSTNIAQEKSKPAPSKQFYFGMIESKQSETQDHLKDFPGLGSPIIEEISNFHLIEKKLLGYHDEDAEFEKFTAQLKEDCKIKNISSESALSSAGSSRSGSARSLGVALRIRPTLPKKQPAVPRFSPAAAWRQLASLQQAHETQPLAVETKMSAELSAESPRSDPSADKSADSGISADHEHRADSPPRHISTEATWTPQQDLGDSSSDGAPVPVPSAFNTTFSPSYSPATYSPAAQPFSLSLPRDERGGKQLQQGFNSLQKFKKSVSGALGAALGSRRFDLEHEPMLQEPEQNWFLTKSAPNSLSNPLLFPPPARAKMSDDDDVIKEESPATSEKDDLNLWRPANNSYLSWGGHVMYLPPGPPGPNGPAAPAQPLSMLGTFDRPVRSKSSGCLEVAARAARAALASEMRERERSASPDVARAIPARVEPIERTTNHSRGKRFTFQSTVRQLERRRIAEKLSKEADLKEQQRRTELEAMRRVEEEFQRKRAREKANIRQQLRLVSSGAASMPVSSQPSKTRDSPDGSCRESPSADRTREARRGHSNASSEISARSKSNTPIRSIELSEWRSPGGAGEARIYRDWSGGLHAHPPACARMPLTPHALYSPAECSAFSGSPRSDNYRLEFARGRSPRTPRAPRMLPAPRSPSTSGSELSMRQPIKIRW